MMMNILDPNYSVKLYPAIGDVLEFSITCASESALLNTLAVSDLDAFFNLASGIPPAINRTGAHVDIYNTFTFTNKLDHKILFQQSGEYNLFKQLLDHINVAEATPTAGRAFQLPATDGEEEPADTNTYPNYGLACFLFIQFQINWNRSLSWLRGPGVPDITVLSINYIYIRSTDSTRLGTLPALGEARAASEYGRWFLKMFIKPEYRYMYRANPNIPINSEHISYSCNAAFVKENIFSRKVDNVQNPEIWKRFMMKKLQYRSSELLTTFPTQFKLFAQFVKSVEEGYKYG
jgi:hypothetical protein